MKSLNDYKLNIYSQFGDDGIIAEILTRTGITGGMCVEFGAWDGVLVANTANLWTRQGWEALLIEPDMEKFKTLQKITRDYKCKCLSEFVTSTGEHSLERILEKENIDVENVKLLSVDIDGNEYHIFKALKQLHPPIVILEYNPTIPADMTVVSKEDEFFGSSAKALCDLANEKGYMVVAISKSNCFFVDKSFTHAFSDVSTSYEELFDPSCLTYFITGYGGAYAFSQQPIYSIGLPLKPSALQEGDLFISKFSPARFRWNRTKDKIKIFLRKIIGKENILKTKSWISYFKWNMKGMPIPPHGIFKWKVLKRESLKYKTEVFIETGTAGADTVLHLEKYFKKLYTIELDPTLYHQAKAKTGSNEKIVCLQGDSGAVIAEILKELDAPATFWLDAHYSGEGTAKGQIDTPIMNELRSILSHKIRNHVIIIDDARDFNGTNDYPTIEQVVEMIKAEAPWYEFSRDNDLMIIAPQNTNIDIT